MGEKFTYSWGYFTDLSVCGQLCHGQEWLADYSEKDFCNIVDNFPKKNITEIEQLTNLGMIPFDSYHPSYWDLCYEGVFYHIQSLSFFFFQKYVILCFYLAKYICYSVKVIL